MTADTFRETRNRLPRFSLRSLILLVLLAGSGFGLWAKWGPWYLLSSFKLPDIIEDKDGTVHFMNSFGFFEDGGFGVNYVSNPDAVTWIGDELVFKIDETTGSLSPLTELPGKPYRESSRDDPLMAVFDALQATKPIDAQIGPSGDRALLLRDCKNEICFNLQVWYRRRPESWWGVAWLPEFWLTVALGVGMLWSLIRDRGLSKAR